MILLAVFLLLLNGFFVAAEFSLVKIRPSRLDVLVQDGRRFAKTAQWLVQHLDGALGACQLGITIASLGLGWIGEPAVASLLEPMLVGVGITSEVVIHGAAFAVGFTVITALHLVIGELAPKALAIRRAEATALLCAVPLRWFSMVFYPVLAVLNGAALGLVRLVGIESTGGLEGGHSEEELRGLLSKAHVAGELTRSEHRLLHAIFEFDDLIIRQVMWPRVDVDFIQFEASYEEWIETVRRTKHTRYPVCAGTLDDTKGIVHVKDLLEHEPIPAEALTQVMRRPHFVPETMPISRLLGHFQAVHQHFALVVDEFGTVTGIVTLENVIEQIVGNVQDEFDLEQPDIVPAGSHSYLVDGRTALDRIERALGVTLDPRDHEVDTLSGLLVEKLGRILQAGDAIDLDAVLAEVVEVKGTRAWQVRLTLKGKPKDAAAAPEESVS